MAQRLYYADAFLARFEALISDIHQISHRPGETLWQIALDRSAFYPTSGGQPHDTGVLIATAPSGATLRAPILAVEEDEAGEVWHTTAKPLLAGTPVRGEIDWDRRRDHMQQHSGQHLLSAAFYREMGARTVSFHLGEKASTIDLAIDPTLALAGGTLSPEQWERVESAANRIIAENRAVTVRTVSREKAEALLAGGALRKLPERDGPIRLIEIGDFDLNACGGTHVHATGQIGGVLIRGAERIRHGVRVEFVCGLRAAGAARQDLALLERAASALSVSHDLVPESVARLLAENKAASKEVRSLREELAGYHAERLALESPMENGVRVVRRAFADRDPAYIRLLASRLTASASHTCALLASTLEKPAKVIVASSRDLNVDCGAALSEALAIYGLRGGGGPTMAQAQIPAAHLDALFSALEGHFRNAHP